MSDERPIRITEDTLGVSFDEAIEVSEKELKGHINYRTGIGYLAIAIFTALGGVAYMSGL